MALTYSAVQVESLKRSAAMAPLPTRQVSEVLEDLRELHHERDKIQRLLKELGPDWRRSRDLLNRIVALMAEPGEPAAD